MKVELTTIEDFCCELEAEAAQGHVHGNIVRLRTDRTPEQDEAISFQVGLWATAVVKREDAQWLLEFACVGGSDEGAEDAGSEVVARWRKQVQRVADRHGLEVRPGKIEIW